MLQGSKCNIDYACRLNGSYPAEEFIKGLTEPERLKLAHILKQLLDMGKVWNVEKFKKLESQPIWEIRADHNRLLCFQSGNCWVLTNGFRKDTQKTKQGYIDLAVAIMNEHLSRQKK
jgi:phage-related protein